MGTGNTEEAGLFSDKRLDSAGYTVAVLFNQTIFAKSVWDIGRGKPSGHLGSRGLYMKGHGCGYVFVCSHGKLKQV